MAGTVSGRKVAGLGYVERSGFESIHDLDQFFSAVGEEVRKAVAATLPLEPKPADVLRLIASPERPQYTDGVDAAQLSRALIKPMRCIIDRGGKAWRSYAALACCEVVKGDSRKFVQWLAMPELLHVGSLIVDDVQDRSSVRRGGPACHVIYGEPVAINAGTSSCASTISTSRRCALDTPGRRSTSTGRASWFRQRWRRAMRPRSNAGFSRPTG